MPGYRDVWDDISMFIILPWPGWSNQIVLTGQSSLSWSSASVEGGRVRLAAISGCHLLVRDAYARLSSLTHTSGDWITGHTQQTLCGPASQDIAALTRTLQHWPVDCSTELNYKALTRHIKHYKALRPFQFNYLSYELRRQEMSHFGI